jgi:hypothetical protein
MQLVAVEKLVVGHRGVTGFYPKVDPRSWRMEITK